ncbi:hypothetical protein Tco_0797898 [Tanacetum coccineum]
MGCQFFHQKVEGLRYKEWLMKSMDKHLGQAVKIVMALPLSPDHAAYFPKIMPAQPELAPVVPDLTPLSPNHVFDFQEGNPDEDLKEESKEEEPEEEEP